MGLIRTTRVLLLSGKTLSSRQSNFSCETDKMLLAGWAEARVVTLFARCQMLFRHSVGPMDLDQQYFPLSLSLVCSHVEFDTLHLTNSALPIVMKYSGYYSRTLQALSMWLRHNRGFRSSNLVRKTKKRVRSGNGVF